MWIVSLSQPKLDKISVRHVHRYFNKIEILFQLAEFLKFVGPSGADFRQVRQKPHTWRSYCPPNIFCCFVCNGFAKHVPWLLNSCLTDCICNLGSKYNGRICPGFINSKSGKQSYPQSFCNIIVDWWD